MLENDSKYSSFQSQIFHRLYVVLEITLKDISMMPVLVVVMGLIIWLIVLTKLKRQESKYIFCYINGPVKMPEKGKTSSSSFFLLH